MKNALDFDSVSFAYPKSSFTLGEITFSVKEGECLALTGENGGGKTTLGKLAAGILRPKSGRVLVSGTDIAPLSLGEIGQRVGYLFQDPSRQLFAPTVLEDLTFPASVCGANEAEASSLARGILERLGLGALENQSVLFLSGGEKQRLAIAGLMMRSPGLLVLDEPTTGLDPENADILEEIIGRLSGNGAAVLLITHDPDFAARYTSRRMCLSGGVLE